MLRKLRIKFLLLTMALLLLVLTVIIGTVNLLNYHHVIGFADQTLKILLEGEGRFPDKFPPSNKPHAPKMSPEIPFETRFFTVQLSEDGTVLFTDTEKITAVTPETAAAYAKKVWDSQRAKGFVGEYRYIVQNNSAESMIVFIDCGRQLNSANSFLFCKFFFIHQRRYLPYGLFCSISASVYFIGKNRKADF